MDEKILKKLDEQGKAIQSINKKLCDHDKRFDDHDKRFDDHDKRFTQIDIRFDRMDKQLERMTLKLIEHDGRMDTFVTKDEFHEAIDRIMTGQDQAMVILQRLDQERLMTNVRLDRIEETHEIDISNINRRLEKKGI